MWIGRVREGVGYRKARIGRTDDHSAPDGHDILTYREAVKRAVEFSRGEDPGAALRYTVADAVADYLAWFELHRKTHDRTRYSCHAHIVPALGTKHVGDLTTKSLGKWRDSLVTAKRGKATVNRTLGILKAALTRARKEVHPFRDTWSEVQKFRGANNPRVRFLSVAECRRLVNACPADFRELVCAALLTGCRYGELTALTVADFDLDAGTIYIAQSKSGHPRHVPLSPEGVDLLDSLTVGKASAERVFVKANGEPWQRSAQQNRIKVASAGAGINPPANFHLLRHVFAGNLAKAGVPMKAVAEALGHTSTAVTEKHYAHLAPDTVAKLVRGSVPSYGGSARATKVAKLSRKHA